jgi:hypothetical protein
MLQGYSCTDEKNLVSASELDRHWRVPDSGGSYDKGSKKRASRMSRKRLRELCLSLFASVYIRGGGYCS